MTSAPFLPPVGQLWSPGAVHSLFLCWGNLPISLGSWARVLPVTYLGTELAAAAHRAMAVPALW